MLSAAKQGFGLACTAALLQIARCSGLQMYAPFCLKALHDSIYAVVSCHHIDVVPLWKSSKPFDVWLVCMDAAASGGPVLYIL